MQSPIPRIGGKRLLAKRIIPKIPNHITYCEPFAGASWILFGKEPSKTEILNDYDSMLTNFYRVLQKHPNELIRVISEQITSRESFTEYKSTNALRTDVERASEFFFIMKLSFSATGENYAPTLEKYGYKRENIEKLLTTASQRLRQVYIENKGYDYVIKRYDRPNTFFYIDPPYYKTEHYYKNGKYDESDHSKLCEILKGIKGKFLLSMNDCQLYRDLYKDYNIEEIATKYSMSSSGQKQVVELLISNY